MDQIGWSHNMNLATNHLVVMMHAHKCPVGDDTIELNASVSGLTRDQILHSCGVEELDVRELKHFAQDRAREESSVLDNNKVFVCIFVPVKPSVTWHIRSWVCSALTVRQPHARRHRLACA